MIIIISHLRCLVNNLILSHITEIPHNLQRQDIIEQAHRTLQQYFYNKRGENHISIYHKNFKILMLGISLSVERRACLCFFCRMPKEHATCQSMLMLKQRMMLIIIIENGHRPQNLWMLLTNADTTDNYGLNIPLCMAILFI